MKRKTRKKVIFFVIWITLFLVIPLKVNAKDVVACHYTVSGFGKDNFSFTITIKDDNSYTLTSEDNISSSGSIIVDPDDTGYGYELSYDKQDMEKFSKKMYSDNKVLTSCPNLYLGIPIDGTNTAIEIRYDTDENSFADNHNPFVNAASDDIKIDETVQKDPDKEENNVICTRYKNIQGNSDYPFAIEFYKDQNDEKHFAIYEVKKSGDGKKWVDAGRGKQDAVYGSKISYMATNRIRYTIYLDEDESNINAFYKSEKSCKKAELHLNAPYGAHARETFFITTKKPEDKNNAVSTTGDDDGTDISPTHSAYQGSWDPNTLCGENNQNCNLDLTKFCTDKYVARTLKFLGIILYIAKIFVPALIILLGIVDLVKILLSGKMEDAKKQGIIIVKRIAIGVVIFLIPTIIITIYNAAESIVNDDQTNTEQTEEGELNIPTDFKNCINCILDPDKCELNLGD